LAVVASVYVHEEACFEHGMKNHWLFALDDGQICHYFCSHLVLLILTLFSNLYRLYAFLSKPADPEAK